MVRYQQKIFFSQTYLKMSSSRSNFASKTIGHFYFYLTNVTARDSKIPQNRLPLEEQKFILRAFLYFNEKALNNSLPGQHKVVDWSCTKSTISLIKEVYTKHCSLSAKLEKN